MEEVIVSDEGLISKSQRMLGETGRLSRAIPGFIARSQQIEMASLVAQAIEKQSVLIAEAGTGTGKTFAYLIPCLLSGKKALISTATKTLQDQLFQKDLPLLIKALGLSARIQNLKGRANYICKYRAELHVNEGQFSNPKCVHDILHVHKNIARLTSGERGELPEIKEDSPAWPYVTSTGENCLGGECPVFDSCFLMKARRRAMKADVVVINHHLFFADSKLKDGGFGELLPGVDAVIFDEAHQVLEIATHFYGERVSTRQLREWMDDTLKEWPILDLANQPLKQYRFELEQITDDLNAHLPKYNDRFMWNTVVTGTGFCQLWEKLGALLQDSLACFDEDLLKEHSGLQNCKARLDELLAQLEHFSAPKSERIRWVERFKTNLVFHATPVEIASAFNALRERQSNSYIFTSATLSMANSFECFTRGLGLDDAHTLLLSSPFDYRQQSLLYLPRSMPDPKHPDYNEALLRKAIPIIGACGGRCFFLFTSHRALQDAAERLQNILDYPLLVQGEESKSILLERFRQLGNAVLLGTATFWEGVDVKGEALSCVIIDKIPFASPSDPVVQGKSEYIRSQGLSPFDELSLPNAVLALKQGVGRLIRDVSDRGILMLADPRITGKRYGQQIFESLPSMKKTRDEQTALSFIETLALKNESISD